MRQRLLAFFGAIDARDVFVFLGLGLVTLGSGMIYLAAAPITAGLILLLIGILGVPKWP